MVLGTAYSDVVVQDISHNATETYSSVVGWLVGWLVGRFLWHINIFRLFNAKSIIAQIICSISNNSVFYEYTV